MSKGLSKKGTERRRKPRGAATAAAKGTAAKRTSAPAKRAKAHGSRDAERSISKKARKSSPAASAKVDEDHCCHCGNDLQNEDKALFVEEEVGRVFCSEDCIASYFSPEIDRLEKDYFRALSRSDLTGEERERLAHLRWVTLEEPDEVWREKTLAGDYRYTLISEFEIQDRTVWCVCICLFLRGEPSFLHLAFPTKNAAMVDNYRRGERVEWVRNKSSGRTERRSEARQALENEDAEAQSSNQAPAIFDGLADAWTEDETMRAQHIQNRRDDDIPEAEFGEYEACVQETLDEPHEVWSMGGEAQSSGEDESGDVPGDASSDAADANDATEDGFRVYHFIRHYPEEEPSGMWFVIVAKETEDAEQIEIVDVFPTRDPELVMQYRKGKLEVGSHDLQPASRTVH